MNYKSPLMSNHNGRQDHEFFALCDDVLSASTQGMSKRQISEKYGMSRTTVDMIIMCADWNRLSDEQKSKYTHTSGRILRWSKQRAGFSTDGDKPPEASAKNNDSESFKLYDDIMADSRSGMSPGEVAAKYSVSYSLVRCIVKCANWSFMTSEQKMRIKSISGRVARWADQHFESPVAPVELSTFSVPLPKDVADYVRIMSTAIGQTRHEFIAAIVLEHKAEHDGLYRALRQLRGLPEEAIEA